MGQVGMQVGRRVYGCADRSHVGMLAPRVGWVEVAGLR